MEHSKIRPDRGDYMESTATEWRRQHGKAARVRVVDVGPFQETRYSERAPVVLGDGTATGPEPWRRRESGERSKGDAGVAVVAVDAVTGEPTGRRPFIVKTRYIRVTWDEWLAIREQDEAKEAQKRAEQEEYQQAKAAAQTAILGRLAAVGAPGVKHRVDHHMQETVLPTALVDALLDHAATTGWRWPGNRAYPAVPRERIPTIDLLPDSEVGVDVTVSRSSGADGAIVVQVDAPIWEDGGPGLRVHLNDATLYADVPLQAWPDGTPLDNARPAHVLSVDLPLTGPGTPYVLHMYGDRPGVPVSSLHHAAERAARVALEVLAAAGVPLGSLTVEPHDLNDIRVTAQRDQGEFTAAEWAAAVAGFGGTVQPETPVTRNPAGPFISRSVTRAGVTLTMFCEPEPAEARS